MTATGDLASEEPIYKKSGSHGCINLPSDAAEFIFENIEPQTPILCYYLEGNRVGIIGV